MGGILRQRKLHWRIQRLDFCRSGPNLPQFSVFSPRFMPFHFLTPEFWYFYFDVLILYVLFGPVTGPLMRLEPHWRIPRDAPVFALMLLRRRRKVLRFEITEQSKLLVLPWSHSNLSLYQDAYILHRKVRTGVPILTRALMRSGELHVLMRGGPKAPPPPYLQK